MSKIDSIKDRYFMELDTLKNHLDDLSEGRIREVSGNTTHSNCSNLANSIKEDINGLISKIVNNENSLYEDLFK